MIYIVYGTRAELIKFSTLIRELTRRKVQFKTVDTGQHDNRLLHSSLKLPKPDFHLGQSYRSTWSGLEASVITYPMASLLALLWGFKVFVKLATIVADGDVVVTHGNAMGVPLAIYAARLSPRKPHIVHMESGFRGNTKNTKLLDLFYKFADKRSDYLFTPFKSAEKNLRDEDVRGKIILSGDVMKDVVKETLKIKSGARKQRGEYIVANITRSVLDKHDARQLLHALKDSPINVILIVNPVIKKRIERFGLGKMLRSEKIRMMGPLNYPEFLHLLKNSIGAVTDSTGVQEECAVMGKPCIVTNNFLQIPELEQAGVVKVAGTNYIAILGGLRKISSRKWKIRSGIVVGRGSPTKKIADHLVSMVRQKP